MLILNNGKLYLLILLLIGFGQVKAVEVKDLYRVKWPVAQQSKSALWKASLAGFKEVLIRKSGSRAILQSFEVQQAYRQVTRYLQRFEYAGQSKNQQYPYLISLYFEPRLIDGLIQEAKMPLWGAHRPLTILWIAVEENFERRILKEGSSVTLSTATEGSNRPLSFYIKRNAVRRGLPVISPLMDLEDELAISTSDIWGRFPSTVLAASQRYPADSALVGRIKKEGARWTGAFTYLNQPVQSSFEVSAEAVEQVIAQMMDKLAERLCNKYCVTEAVGQENEVLINLSGVYDFKNFKASEQYLNSLPGVKKAKVIKIVDHNLLFKLSLLGQVTSVVEGIALSKTMKIDAESEAKIKAKKETEVTLLQQTRLAGDGSPSSLAMDNHSNLPKPPEPPEPTVISPAAEEGSLSQPAEVDLDDSQKQEPELPTLYYRWLG